MATSFFLMWLFCFFTNKIQRPTITQKFDYLHPEKHFSYTNNCIFDINAVYLRRFSL